MAITTLLWDVGGVCLSNAWDHNQRGVIARQFNFDQPAFEHRHAELVDPLERGQMSFEEYLRLTLFEETRPFTLQEVRAAIQDQSRAIEPTLELLRHLRRSTRYLLATLNNESREMNSYRIARFHLNEIFGVFFTSCFLDLRKPQPRIYQLALDLCHRSAAECVFIDDRPFNCEVARKVGIHAIQYTDMEQLRSALKDVGVTV
ncbi:MAG: HAD family phosphatase [Herpetosiphon sp.]